MGFCHVTAPFVVAPFVPLVVAPVVVVVAAPLVGVPFVGPVLWGCPGDRTVVSPDRGAGVGTVVRVVLGAVVGPVFRWVPLATVCSTAVHLRAIGPFWRPSPSPYGLGLPPGWNTPLVPGSVGVVRFVGCLSA